MKGKCFLDEQLKLAELGKWASMVEVASPQPKDVVLDLGTGTGNTAIYLSNKVRNVVAVDEEQAHLVCAREKAREKGINNIEWVEMEIKDNLSRWRDQTFTLVCCRATLHHLAHRQEIFEEVARILRPDGRFDIMDPIVSESLRNFWTPISRMGESDHHSYCTYFELMRLFKIANLKVQQIVPFQMKRDLDEWLTRFSTIDKTGRLSQRALELITEFMPPSLKDELDLTLGVNGKWEFKYNCVEVVAIKQNGAEK